MTLSLQLLGNYWSIYHETWYVDRTSYGVMHIGRKFWSPHFCGSYAPWNLENIRKSTNNLSFLCQFFINEITASDAGPDIIRSHLFPPYISFHLKYFSKSFLHSLHHAKDHILVMGMDVHIYVLTVQIIIYFSRVFEKHDHLAFVNRAQLIILWDLSPIATTLVSCVFLPASPKAKAGLGVQSHRPSVRPSVPKTWIPITLGCFVPSLVEIGPVVLEKSSKIGKVYRRTDGHTDRRRMTGDQKSSLVLSAHVS